VAILARGCLAHWGAPERVITEDNMRNIYGVKVKVINLSNGRDRKVCVPFLEENFQ
jgi:iron complex transport system ATP-binding protein